MRLASSRRRWSTTTTASETRSRARGLPLLLVLIAAAALPAHAHQGDPNVFTRIDSITPALPGVTIQVRAGVADQLFVLNHTAEPVDVLDENGVVFLRIGPKDVRADVGTAAWLTSNRPLGEPVRGGPRPPAKGLVVVSRGSSWGWFDHRLHDRPFSAPPAARAVTRLADWTIPMRHGGTDVVVKGHVEYRPVTGAFRTQVARMPAGAAVDTLDGRVPGLLLRWQGAGTLTVRGIDGEPFARFTPKGVEVNDASRTWQDDQRLRGRPARTALDPAVPVWTKAGSAPSLTWLDRRLAYTPGVPPADALRSTRPTTVVEWDIPVDVDGAASHLQGTTTWVPNAVAASGSRPWLPVVVVAVVLVATVGLRRKLTAR